MNYIFKAATGTEEKFKVESEIIYASWQTQAVCGGSEAPVEVGLRMVGDGAPIEFVCKTSNGKKLGVLKGVVSGKQFSGLIPISNKVQFGETATFEVKLPKHGLSLESNIVPVYPAIVVKSMNWDRNEVWHNDEVGISAEFDDIPDQTPVKVTVYEYKESGAHLPFANLETRIQNNKLSLKWKFTYKKETEDIPSEEDMQKVGKKYEPVKLFFSLFVYSQMIGMMQESGFLLFKDVATIQVFDEYGKPLAKADCLLIMPDGTEKNVTTDDNGDVALWDLPPGKIKIKIKPASVSK